MKVTTRFLGVLAFAGCAPSAWALVGGPWDHLASGTFSRANTDGVYEASVTMKDGSGFIRFISSTTRATLSDPDETQTSSSTDLFFGTSTQTDNSSVSALSARSNAVIFYKGNAYYGTVYGTVNANSKTVVGGGGGQSSVVDQVESSVKDFADQIQALVSIQGFSESMNLTFDGRITQEIPDFRFEASGNVVFFSRPDIKVSQISTSTAPTNEFTLYQIELTTPPGAPLTPDATVAMRMFGGRITLQTSFATAATP